MIYFCPRENKRSVYLLQLFLYDSTMIAPFPLLFFGGDISVFMEEGYETVAVDDFIKFKSPTRIANLVKVCVAIRISPRNPPQRKSEGTRDEEERLKEELHCRVMKIT